jgi:two-component SAPR family response regulator
MYLLRFYRLDEYAIKSFEYNALDYLLNQSTKEVLRAQKKVNTNLTERAEK